MVKTETKGAKSDNKKSVFSSSFASTSWWDLYLLSDEFIWHRSWM